MSLIEIVVELIDIDDFDRVPSPSPVENLSGLCVVERRHGTLKDGGHQGYEQLQSWEKLNTTQHVIPISRRVALTLLMFCQPPDACCKHSFNMFLALAALLLPV